MQNPLGLEWTGGAFPRTVPPGVKLLCLRAFAASLRLRQNVLLYPLRSGRGQGCARCAPPLPDLRHLYGKEAESFPAGAIGVFSYLNRIAMGLRHFAALNRKFDVNLLGPDDLIPLTPEAAELLAGR